MTQRKIHKMNDFADVLEVLANNDGACLYWQMPNAARAEAALEAGVITLDDFDLLVHPGAVFIEDGAYAMPTPRNRNVT